MGRTILLAAILTCVMQQIVFAATLNVPADYPTIQAAVDASASGDTVLLEDGVYTGSGNCDAVISRSITVASQNGPESTILDCPGSRSGIKLDLIGSYCPEVVPGGAGSLEVGRTYYTDRDYTLTDVPSQYQEMNMLVLADDDRDRTDVSDYITFGAYCDLVVYVAYDSRAVSLPDWMTGFYYTGNNLYTSLSSQDHLKIYSRIYSDGECVNLGANKAPGFSGGEVDNYLVFYHEDGPCAPVSIEGLQIKNAGDGLNAYGRSLLSDFWWATKPFAIHNCALIENGVGVYAFSGTGEINSSYFGNNSFTAIYLEYAAADVFDDSLLNNSYGIYGYNGGAIVDRCLISGNSVNGLNMFESYLYLYNSIVSYSGEYGVEMGYALTDIFNTTVFGNAGGLYNVENFVDVTNSIFWNNGAFEIQNADYSYNDLSIRNSDLEGGIAAIMSPTPVIDLGGNIDADPRFIDPDGADDIPGTADDNLHLKADSPCIDAGTMDLPTGGDFDFDIDLDPRVAGTAPDMGADETEPIFTFFRDRDRDGYGDPRISLQAITRPRGYVEDNTDCNDRKASVHPGARELCNHRDDDCDGRVDEGCNRPRHPNG